MKPYINLLCGRDVDKSLIKPAQRKRQWMDNTPNKFAYRCLPLSVANQYGWEFCCPFSFSAVWRGGLDMDQVEITSEESSNFVSTHFGSGIITFNINVIIKTDSSHNLLITGPFNDGKSFIFPLSGVIESDWMPYTFTMNWKFSEKDVPVSFEKGEPFCRVFPIPKNIEEYEFTIEDLSEEKYTEITQEMKRWSDTRRNFDEQRYCGKDWSANLPGLYYKGVYADGSKCPTEHKTRLNLDVTEKE